MKLNITARGFDLTESIKLYIKNAIAKHIEKYFANDTSINIRAILTHDVLKKYITHFILNDDHGEFINISADAKEAYVSVDAAVSCLNNKLRKYKEKLIYYRNKKFRKQSEKAKSYLLKNTDYHLDYYLEDDSGVVIEENGSNEDIDASRIVIEEYDVPLKTMSVKDAVMEMDLFSLPALLFINARTIVINMVYIRKDGNIGWVEPALKAS